jgi:hypothetical protein
MFEIKPTADTLKGGSENLQRKAGQKLNDGSSLATSNYQLHLTLYRNIE